ncbi:MAG TPA: hypothetical protein DC049_17090, partial [Spirochaetia bacterium]|nr:hypothetical protein [Spirochaetia bacterium]
SDARYYLGASFYNQGRYEDALEYLGLFRKTMPADGELSWWADFYYARSLERMKRLREAYLMARNMLGKREKQDLYLMLLRLSEDLAPDEYKNYKNLFLKKFPGSYLSYLIYKKDAFTELRSSNYDSGLAYLKKAYSSRRDDYTAIENICRGRDLSGIVISNTDLFYNYIFFLEPSAVNTATNFSEFIKTHDAEIFDESEEDINILNNCLHPLAFQAEKSKKSFVMGTDGFFSNYYTFLPEAAGHAYHERFSLLLLFEEYDALSREINRVFSDQPEKAFYYLNKLDDQKNDLYSSLLRAARIINARMSFLQLIPYDFLKLSWPLYKKDTVLYFSRLYRVPPLLVYAVIREESHFKTGAFSEAGASGLMQLMDSTAREIFRKRRLNEFYEYNLKDDVLNLQLGIDHLGTLLSQFKGSLMHTVAAYNGGGGNVRKWMQGSYRDLLHFVLFIPFDQTEQYVKKVMTSYYIYNCLYQDDPDFFPEKKNNIK